MDSLPMIDTNYTQGAILSDLVLQPMAEKRILIAEDDLSLQPLWEKAIATRGGPVIVDWATSMTDAERLIRYRFKQGTPYDLVVSDIFLEGVGSGIDLWNHYGEETKNFVFVTAVPNARRETIQEARFRTSGVLAKTTEFTEVLTNYRFSLRNEITHGGDLWNTHKN